MWESIKVSRKQCGRALRYRESNLGEHEGIDKAIWKPNKNTKPTREKSQPGEGQHRSQPARKANQSSRSNRSQPYRRANQGSAANQRSAANQTMKPTTREPTPEYVSLADPVCHKYAYSFVAQFLPGRNMVQSTLRQGT